MPVKKRITQILIMVLSFLTLNKCQLMNDNPILKHKPEEFFERPQLEIAKAIRQNSPDMIEKLMADYPNLNLNKRGKKGVTLLFWAAAHRYPKTVEKLLNFGADPNITLDDEDSVTHLVAMCASGINDETFNLILNYGGDPDGEIEGTPALFKTVYARRFDRMNTLLEKGADIDAIDKQTDLSLVHFCATLNLFEQVAFLIGKGADFERKDKVGASVAYQVQKRKGQLNEETEKWRAIVEEMLIERGVKFPIPHPYYLRKK